MARKGGPSPEGPTRQVRLYEEEADMVYWLGEVTGKSTAAIMRPICRSGLSSLFDLHRAAIDRLKAMRAEEDRIRADAQHRSLPDQPPEGGQLPPTERPGTDARPRRRRRDGGS